MIINGENRFLRITLVDLITLVTVIAGIVGVYFKFDGRITNLEVFSPHSDLTGRVTTIEQKLSSMDDKIDSIKDTAKKAETNIDWIMRRMEPPNNGPKP